MQDQKEYFMHRALELASRGAGHTDPNPMVGCVIVKDGRIIGEGWHEHIGGLHAERNAFAHCTETFMSRLSRAVTGGARRPARTPSSSTVSAACLSAASTPTPSLPERAQKFSGTRASR